VIAENLFSQVDPEGNRLALLDDIIDYRTDGGEQLSIDDAAFVTSSGTVRHKKSTVGW
jgi:hypothetical protein